MNAPQRFMQLFAGHESAHGMHGEPDWDEVKGKWDIKRTACTLRSPATEQLWQSHLDGKCPLGVITIRQDGTCAWGSIDVDVYDEDLSIIIEKIADRKLPLIAVRSKSGGLHLFLFLATAQPATDVQRTLRDIAANLGLAGSEIFPKQVVLVADRGDLGNWMIMPYFGGTYGGKLKEQVGVNADGSVMTAELFLDAAESIRLTAERKPTNDCSSPM